MEIKECLYLLGLSNLSDLDQLHRAYRRQVRCWHPDQFAQQPEIRARAEERLKQINQAYLRLKKMLPHKRPHHGSVRDHTEKPSNGGADTSKNQVNAYVKLKQWIKTWQPEKFSHKPRSYRDKARKTHKRQKPSFDRVFEKVAAQPDQTVPNSGDAVNPIMYHRLLKRRKKKMRVDGFASPSPLTPVQPISKISGIDGFD